MLHIVWQFHARPNRLTEFETHYGGGGSWAQLFRKGSGFKGTVCLRDHKEPTRFVVIDIWESAAAFAHFKQRFGTEYAELDKRCEELTLVEEPLGQFESL